MKSINRESRLANYTHRVYKLLGVISVNIVVMVQIHQLLHLFYIAFMKTPDRLP